MKSMLREVISKDGRYSGLMFVCPGCREAGGSGLHMLPVNSFEIIDETDKRPMWTWDEDLEKPTISPSILTKGGPPDNQYICHSYLKEGIFQYLGDCTHSLVNQHVPLPDLPDWVIDEQRSEAK